MGRKKLYDFDTQMCDSPRNEGIAHWKENSISNTIIDAQDNMIFAALKMIEELYKNKKITRKDFSDILIEYSDRVDTGKFMVGIPDPGELLKEVTLCTI